MGLIHRRRWRLRTAVTLAACLLSSGVAAGEQGYAELQPFAVPGGIWKAAVPAPGSMHGEFANHDPLGLAAGVAIAADCSINWVDPDTGKLYCFASATSLVMFLDGPHACLERARAQWLRLHRPQ
jgi:hypothetical protein